MKTVYFFVAAAIQFVVPEALAATDVASRLSVPLVVQSEAGPVKTSACLSLLGRKMGDAEWWVDGVKQGQGPEFAQLISALKAKDSARFRGLVDPTWAKAVDRLEFQERALFDQFQRARVVRAPLSFDIGKLRIYLALIEMGGRSAWIPFFFSQGSDRTYRYLPERTESKTADLILEWIRSGGAGNDAAQLCDDSRVAQAGSRLPLSALAAVDSEASLIVQDSGAVPVPGPEKGAAAALAQIMVAKKAAMGRNFDAYVSTLTDKGADAVRQWWKTADQDARTRYLASWDDIKPIAWLDLSPITVVVVEVGPQQLQAIYVLNRDGKPALLNRTYLSSADPLFKAAESPLLSKAKDANFVKSLRQASPKSK